MVVICILFGLSLQPGAASTETTGALSSSIADVFHIDPGTTEGTIHGIGGVNIERINLLIRSLAHIIAFGGLGLMLCLGCFLSQFATKSYILLTLGIGSLVALMDETIKLFIPGRHFNGIDAVKDVVGLVLALIFCFCLHLIYKRFMSPSSTSHIHKA